MRAGLLVCRLLAPRREAGGGGEAPDAGAVILIAARNEAGTIGPTVESLSGLPGEWPGSEVWVIADRSTDGTAIEAGLAGARLAVRREGAGGKGAALDWWLGLYEQVWRGKSAVVILDADSRMEPGSLALLRAAIADGADAAQSSVAPVAGSRVGRLAGWSEVLMQRIDDEARYRLRWPVPLRGCGMAIRPELLAGLAPRLHTQAEDLELDVLLATCGARVDFVSGAVLRDEKPRRIAGASRQRARWLAGQIDVLRDYLPELGRILSGRYRKRRERAGRSLIGDLFLFPLLFLRPKLGMILLRLLLLAVAPKVAAIGLGLDLLYYLAGAIFVDQPRRYLLDLLLAPGYLVVWLGGLLMIRRRRRETWLRAGR